MPWVQLDDQIANHPKILKAGPEAAWMWACAIAYCQNHLTDGHVPADALRSLESYKNPRAVADRLVEARKSPDGQGLFERRDDDYAVHDYLKSNASKAVVLERRAKAAARKARERARREPEKEREDEDSTVTA